MTTASLSRDGTSVSFELAQSGGGTPTIVEAVSKPNQKFQPIARVDPRTSDFFQSVKTFILRGYIDGDTAYQDARVLAEELIKPHSGGNDLTLDLSNADGFGSYTVAPAGENAAEIEYLPGQRDWVPISLNLTQVDETIGGSSSGVSGTSGAVPQGGGSVTLRNPDTGDSVDVLHDLTLTRTVGRSGTTVRPDPSDVVYIDKIRPATDEWSLSGVLEGGQARSNSQTLIDILSSKLERDALKLEFNNNIYALSDKDVVPAGAEAGRRLIGASEPDMVRVNNITLRTVTV